MEINHNPVFRESFAKQQNERLQEEAAKSRLLRKAQLQAIRAEKKGLGRFDNIRDLISSVISSLKETGVWLSRVKEIGIGSRTHL